MPAIQVKLNGKSRVLLNLNPVPQRLCKSMLRQYKSLEEYASPGLPVVVEDESETVTVRYPPVTQALPDRIRYYYQRDGILVAASPETFKTDNGHHLPVGIIANNADSSVFKDKSIVLLLESPHVDEMKHRQPAAGDTGEEIDLRRAALGRILKPLVDQLYPDPDWTELPVVIANPCPYPTSCLVSTTTWGILRDLVFSKVFPQVDKSFQARLTHYNPVVILNACTDGAKTAHILRFDDKNFSIEDEYKPPSPKDLVATSILNWIGKKRCFERRSYVNDQENADFTERVQKKKTCEDLCYDGFILDFGHPSSWRTPRE